MPVNLCPVQHVTVVWTKRAVARWDNNGTFDLRHKITNYPVYPDSQWFRDDMNRKFGTSWVLIDNDGAMLARS